MPLPNGDLTMADDILAANLQGVVADAYGCYDNGRWPDAQAVAAEHPGAKILDFSVFLANVGKGGDVEPGDMTPAQGVLWIKERLGSGVVRPVGYSSIGDQVNGMPELVRLAEGAGLQWPRDYRRLSAHWDWPGQLPGLQKGQHICGPDTCGSPIQCDGTQWYSGPSFDLSVLRPDFFGPEPAGPWPTGAQDVRGLAETTDGRGYWVAGAAGEVKPLGDAAQYGEVTSPLNKPVVAIRRTPTGRGFWLTAADGGVFNFGDAGFHGSLGSVNLVAPVVDMAVTPTGGGYWLVLADGYVKEFGDAVHYGDVGTVRLNKPIVGMTPTPSGRGYLLVAADGGVFQFGDAHFFGSTGSLKLAAPIVGMALRPGGDGYWLAGADGGVFTFGAAGFFGSMGGRHLNGPVVDISSTPSGNGYLMVATDGGVFTFGDAHFEGV